MAAVAGTPPKKGMMMLPMPCATNSWFACKRMPVILLATAPQSRDSTALSAAIERAGTSSELTLPHGIASSVSRSSSKMVRGMAPMLAASQPVANTSSVAAMMPISEAGTKRLHAFGQKIISRITTMPTTTVGQSGSQPP